MNGLPAPYPDEFWYSILARRLRDWGYVNRLAELQQVYGSRPPVINMAAPLRPGKFFVDTGGNELPSTRTLAVRHTLLPYYLAFASPARRQAALNVIDGADVLAKLSLGTVTRKLVPSFLRFCKDCIEVDRLLVGESYWHRSHQVPGLHRCPEHGGVLFESSVPYLPDRLDYWTAHPSRCCATPASRVVESMGRVLARAVGQVLRSVLSTGDMVDLWIDKRRYVALLTKCGYGAARGRVATTAFEDGFRSFLRRRHAEPAAFGPTAWWLAAFTGVPGALTPLQHLLLREFIRHSLIRNRQSAVPIGVVEAHLQFAS